jgi:hypothetical protein
MSKIKNVCGMFRNKGRSYIDAFISFYSFNRTESTSVHGVPFIALVASSAGLETGRSGAFV